MTILSFIATGKKTAKEVQISIKTFDLWNDGAIIYIATDSATYPLLEHLIIERKYPTYIIQILDKYTGLTRDMMEKMPGMTYSSLFGDFVYEKLNIIKHIFENEEKEVSKSGIWFMDADIIHFGPLPYIEIPSNVKIALSPHYISESECEKYGKYNAGYIWIKDIKYLNIWRAAGHRSHYYEQAALNYVAKVARDYNELYEFGENVNFGWWRMYQGDLSSTEIQANFSIRRYDFTSGITYNGKYLSSVHTHLWDVNDTTGLFNKWLINYLNTKLSKYHIPARKLLDIIQDK